MAEAVQSLADFPDPDSDRTMVGSGLSFGLVLGLFLSVALHGAALYALVAESRHAQPPRPSQEINVDIQTVQRPPPPPEPKVERKPMRSARVARVVPKEAPTPPTPVAPPPPSQQAPAPNPAPIRIGVNLDSTVENGAFAAPVGNSMYGVAPTTAPVPSAQPYWAAKFVAPQRVAELPVLIGEVKAPYPPAARKAGIEGPVILMLTIDDTGKVARVRKVTGPGHGLDEAAVAAASQFTFKPARYNGAAVATEIRYVYSFEID
jgi:protein TonB